MTQLVTQAMFARLCGVSRQRVGQWIEAAQVGGDAIAGEGRGRRINVEVARAQLRERLDDVQRTGINGLDTKLDTGDASITVDQEIKLARLRLVNAQADKAEATRDAVEADSIQRAEAAVEHLRQRDMFKSMIAEACRLTAEMAISTKYHNLDSRLLTHWLGVCFLEAWRRWEGSDPVVFGQPTTHWQELVADFEEKKRLYGDKWGA